MSHTGNFSIPVEMLGGGDSSRMFQLQVHDDAMSAVGIADGDWVIIREQDETEDGATVAVMHNGDTIVRRLTRGRDGTVSFTADETSYRPIPADQAKVIGRGIAAIRLI